MSLREKINQQFNAALKDKNKTLVSTLRLILASVKERDIANRGGGKKEDVKDDEIIKVLRKMKKQRQDSSDLYKKGGRNEFLEIEEEEIKVTKNNPKYSGKKIGRNEPCFCGSGKKFKHCHGAL